MSRTWIRLIATAVVSMALSQAACKPRPDAPAVAPAERKPVLSDQQVAAMGDAEALLDDAASRTHVWTQQQDNRFFHELAKLPSQTRFALALRMVNQINQQQMKRMYGDDAVAASLASRPSEKGIEIVAHHACP
jgi:hypothetical protein